MDIEYAVNESFILIIEKLDSDEIYKSMFLDIIKFGIENNDYVGIVDRFSDFFKIDPKIAQNILFKLSFPEEFELLNNVISERHLSFFKAIAITYGESIGRVRSYFFSDNKNLLYESNIKNYKDKIAIDLTRFDNENFFLELDFKSSLIFANRITTSWNKIIKKHGIPIDRNDYFDLVLQLKGSVSRLSFDVKPQSSGDVHDS